MNKNSWCRPTDVHAHDFVDALTSGSLDHATMRILTTSLKLKPSRVRCKPSVHCLYTALSNRAKAYSRRLSVSPVRLNKGPIEVLRRIIVAYDTVLDLGRYM